MLAITDRLLRNIFQKQIYNLTGNGIDIDY